MTPQTDEETSASHYEYLYAVERSSEDVNQKVLGGYKVNEDIFDNGGIICKDREEAERLQKLRGWDVKRVSPEQYEPQEVDHVPDQHLRETQRYAAPSEDSNIRKFLEHQDYQQLRRMASDLQDNGAPAIDGRSTKEEHIEFITKYWSQYGKGA